MIKGSRSGASLSFTFFNRQILSMESRDLEIQVSGKLVTLKKPCLMKTTICNYRRIRKPTLPRAHE